MSDGSAHEPYTPLFGDRDATSELGARAFLQRILDVEVALAEAETELAILPPSAVEPIRRAAKADAFDLAALADEAAVAGNFAIPVVEHLTRRVATQDPAAARFVHWGATSQDVLDTAMVLQLQRAVPHILGYLSRASRSAASLAREHIDSVMPARTLLQQATPTTFGLKAAGWLDALERVRSGLEDALERTRVVQFGGASGTLAALGEKGVQVADRVAARLGLSVPPVPWHAHRDRLAQAACALGVVCGSCGKIARDLSLLAQTEVGEAAESRPRGGGSSTMPHKRNSVSASVALAAATRAPGLVATMLSAMPQEHERGIGGWHAEWTTMPELVGVAAGAARAIADALQTLRVDPTRMRANVELTRGLVLAEAVTMSLAVHIGRAEAYKRVEKATRLATVTGGTLADALAADPEVTRYLTVDEIVARLSPDAYLGAARQMVHRVLARMGGER